VLNALDPNKEPYSGPITFRIPLAISSPSHSATQQPPLRLLSLSHAFVAYVAELVPNRVTYLARPRLDIYTESDGISTSLS